MVGRFKNTHFLRTSGDIEGINYAYVYICRGNDLMLSRMNYQTSKKLDTKTVAPFFALGQSRRRILKSIEIYKKGLKIDPQDDSLLMNIANSFLKYTKADV